MSAYPDDLFDKGYCCPRCGGRYEDKWRTIEGTATEHEVCPFCDTPRKGRKPRPVDDLTPFVPDEQERDTIFLDALRDAYGSEAAERQWNADSRLRTALHAAFTLKHYWLPHAREYGSDARSKARAMLVERLRKCRLS